MNGRIPALQLGMGWFPQQAGGLNRVYYNLIRHLPGAGVDVEGMVLGNKPLVQPLRGHIETIAPPTVSLPIRWIGARKVMRRSLSEHRFELAASHFALYTFPVLDLIRHLPLVIHFHGPWASEGFVERPNQFIRLLKFFVEKTVYRQGNLFIVLSNAFSSVLQSEYGVPESRIRIVPGGVNTDEFDIKLTREEARSALGWPADRPVILAVRRLARRMGLENLIAAMSSVRDSVPDALLCIAGKGPLAEELQARVVGAGLEQHVRLLGYVPDEQLPLVYRAADVSIVPTVSLEGFGLITIESLAAGTPVLVTPVGGLPEVVRGLSTDMVLPDARKETISDHLAGVLKQNIRMPDAAECKAYAQAHFDWSIIAARTRSVYEEVLE